MMHRATLCSQMCDTMVQHSHSPNGYGNWPYVPSGGRGAHRPEPKPAETSANTLAHYTTLHYATLHTQQPSHVFTHGQLLLRVTYKPPTSPPATPPVFITYRTNKESLSSYITDPSHLEEISSQRFPPSAPLLPSNEASHSRDKSLPPLPPPPLLPTLILLLHPRSASFHRPCRVPRSGPTLCFHSACTSEPSPCGSNLPETATPEYADRLIQLQLGSPVNASAALSKD